MPVLAALYLAQAWLDLACLAGPGLVAYLADLGFDFDLDFVDFADLGFDLGFDFAGFCFDFVVAAVAPVA